MTALALVPKSVEIAEWVKRWAKCYGSKERDAKYITAMEKLRLVTDEESFEKTKDVLKVAFEWKNGRRLSKPKSRSIAKIDFVQWKKVSNQTEFGKFFSGAVWNIFLWHLATGGVKPIFDQHSWRAFCHLHNGVCEELKEADIEQIRGFYRQYDNWFRARVEEGIDQRELDRAMMAFGQFLRGQFGPLINRVQ